MESPAAIVKSALNVSAIIKFIVATVVAFAIFDALGWTNWLLFPVTTAKSKFGKTATP
jgi:hypothetical protein